MMNFTSRVRRLSVTAVLALLVGLVLSLGAASIAVGSVAKPPATPPGLGDGAKQVYEWSYAASEQSTPPIEIGSDASVPLATIDNPPAVPEGYRWVVEMVSMNAHASFPEGSGAAMVYFDLQNSNSARLLVPMVVTQQYSTGINWVGTIETHLYIDNPTDADMVTTLEYGLFGGMETTADAYFTVSLFGYLVPITS